MNRYTQLFLALNEESRSKFITDFHTDLAAELSLHSTYLLNIGRTVSDARPLVNVNSR